MKLLSLSGARILFHPFQGEKMFIILVNVSFSFTKKYIYKCKVNYQKLILAASLSSLYLRKRTRRQGRVRKKKKKKESIKQKSLQDAKYGGVFTVS